jgi:hypothetical protein
VNLIVVARELRPRPVDAVEHRPQFLRRRLFRDDRLALELGAHFGIAQHDPDLAVQPLHHIARGPRRREHDLGREHPSRP